VAKTLLRNKDIASGAGIGTDKCSDTGQNNKFLTEAQKTALTTGQNADTMHWHGGVGAISVQFGSNRRVGAGQFIDLNGIPSNVCGLPTAMAGRVLSVCISLADVVAGSDAHINVYSDAVSLIDITIPVGARKSHTHMLDLPFGMDTELRCAVTQGEVNKPSIFIEFRWA
jgi:hypothetical protein